MLMQKKSFTTLLLLSLVFFLNSCNSRTIENTPVQFETENGIQKYSYAYVHYVQKLSEAIQSNIDVITDGDDVDTLGGIVFQKLPNDLQNELENFALSDINTSNLRSIIEERVVEVITLALSYVEPYVYDEDVNGLDSAITSFYNSNEYDTLSPDEKSLVSSTFKLLDTFRLTFIAEMSLVSNNGAQTRMSPGDRMIWSQAVQSMTDCQRDSATKISIKSITSAIRGKGFIRGAISVARDIYDYVTC